MLIEGGPCVALIILASNQASEPFSWIGLKRPLGQLFVGRGVKDNVLAQYPFRTAALRIVAHICKRNDCRIDISFETNIERIIVFFCTLAEAWPDPIIVREFAHQFVERYPLIFLANSFDIGALARMVTVTGAFTRE